jgi:hypothetical protein
VFTGALDVLGNSTAGSNLKLYEDTDNGTNYVSFKAPDTIASNVTWTLPSADGTNTQVLQTNGSGVLSFVAAGGASAATPTALGTVYGLTNTGGNFSISLGYQAGSTSTGTNNTSIGFQAGYTNNNNRCTFLGYRAGYLSDALENTFLGYQAGVAVTSGDYNTFVGTGAGLANTTGVRNTFVGRSSGEAITTGGRNSILGWYSGNQDGLDIRTASNYAVISDGDGNRLLTTANGQTLALDGGAVPNSGTGITFPATQSASSDANTLDDYEEGTWTPSVGGTATYTVQVGTYTKIGRVVTYTFDVAISSIGTGSTFNVSGLPFASNATFYWGGSAVYFASSATNVVSFFPRIDPSNTSITVASLAAAGNGSGNNAIFGNSTRVIVIGTYQV